MRDVEHIRNQYKLEQRHKSAGDCGEASSFQMIRSERAEDWTSAGFRRCGWVPRDRCKEAVSAEKALRFHWPIEPCYKRAPRPLCQ